MAELLTDPAAVKESWRKMAANDPVVAPSEPKTIDPNAKLKLAAQDPFAGLEPVQPDAFSGLEEVKQGPDAFAGLQQADALDLKDVKSLTDDDTFRPADYFAENPDLRKDEVKSKKLLDVYRARRVRGLEAGKVAKAAVTEAPGIVAKTVKGVRDLAARAIEVGIQPAATSVLATLTGATLEEKAAIMAEQGKEQLRAAGEVTAGTESAITGLSQLGQQGARKLFGKSPEKMSDSELLDQLYLDSEFSKTTKEVSEGKGEVAKAAGLDADTLAKNGVTLDKEAIEHLSLVDPLTLVAVGGAFKVVGLGGKVIATAATKAGAQTVINGIGNLAKTVGAKSVEAAGRTAVTVGKTAQSIAERLPAKSVGFVLGATKTGTLQGGAVGAAAGEAAKRIGVETSAALAKRGERIAELGSQLSPGFVGPKSAGVTRLLSLPSTTAGQIATRAAGGAVQGAVTAAPLVAAADESETAGALLGGGIALGAIHGAAVGGGKAIAETVAKNYLDPHNIPFEATNSPAYGKDAALDTVHESALKTLPESEQNAVNAFREAIRAGGGEIYVQDAQSYGNRVRESLLNDNGGQPLTPKQEAQAKLYADTHAVFDGNITDAKGETRRVVFLNSSAKGLPHDAGHLFQSLLSPENQASLRETTLKSYSKEQLQAFKEEYARRIGEPDYFNRLGDEANNKAADELIAENFGQLFQNKTFADLSAPRSFLKKLGDTAVQAGEALGFDLTAGRTTADLGAKPSFRLQDLLRNAAQDVLTREPSKLPVPEKKPLSLRPEDVARREANVPVTKEIIPEDVTPKAAPEVLPKEPVLPPAEKAPVSEIPESTAKNIRVERTAQSDFASKRAEETGIAEAQKATEADAEARKVVDDIAKSMEAGNPVLEVEHRGIVSERGPASPEGRTSRRGTQEAGYQELERLQIENRAEAPADIVDLHQKTFVPVRFTTQGGKPTLIAMSLDKVIANVRRVVKDAVSNKAESLLPYPVENGKLTDAGWKQAIDDIKAYSENQSNGYRGDGQKLVRPTEDTGVSLPAENLNYTPKTLSEGAMNFANLVQGLAPPETGRVQKGLTPGNVKGQLLAEVNKKQPMTPAVIKPENVTKQSFKGFEPRTVKETNPLRNELAARGVKVRELTEVTERLAVQDIASVKPRPDINFKAPATDIIRGGFLPGDRGEFNRSFLPSDSVSKELDPVAMAAIRTPGGRIFTGSWHGEAGMNLIDAVSNGTLGEEIPRNRLSQLSEGDLSGFGEDGFTTVSGKFLTREEALAHAKAIKQLREDRTSTVYESKGYLESDELTKNRSFLPGNETDKAVRTGMLPDTKPSEPTPSADIRSLATNYAKGAGINYRPSRTYGAIDPALSKRLADFYEGTKSNPADPAVKSSYDALTKETMDQYKAITDAGYKIEPYTGRGEPYPNSAAAVSDIRDNKHLYFLKTEEPNFAGEGSNPLLADSTVPGLKVNDIFRAVHDFFGHGKEGYQFGPRGEFNAWRAHSEMFSPEAQGALAAETLAQNSWVNFGKHLRDANGNIVAKGEKNYVPLEDRPFGEQKNVVVPQVLIDAARKAAGESPKFLPGDKPVAELGPEIQKMSADEWKKFTESQGGSLTKDAYKLGLELKDRADLDLLKGFQEEATKAGKEALQRYVGGDESGMVEASLNGSKGQFFREAIEAATDTGSARHPTYGWRRNFSESKPPFAGVNMGLKFLPRTEAGKKAAERGFDLQLDENSDKTQFVIRAVDSKTGKDVGRMEFHLNESGDGEIRGVKVDEEFREKGIGEALYREAGQKMKDLGATEVVGEIVGPEAYHLRKKVFPNTRNVRGAEHQADYLTVSKIGPRSKFLPRAEAEEYSQSAPKKVDYEKIQEGSVLFRSAFHKGSVLTSGKAINGAGWLLPDGRLLDVEQAFYHDDAATSMSEIAAPEKSLASPQFQLEYGGIRVAISDSPNTVRDEGNSALGISLSRKPTGAQKEAILSSLKQEVDSDNPYFGEVRIDVQDAQGKVLSGKIFSYPSERGKLARFLENPFAEEFQTKDGAQFLPKKRNVQVSDVRKRETVDERMAREIGETDFSKYDMPKNAPKAGAATGWILPNQEFVPLDAAYHEQFLAENAAGLNKKFGTKLGNTPNVDERFDALNKGFVRVRYTPADGAMRIELSAAHWNPKTKKAILDQIEAQSDNIDRLYVALMDKKGGIADSITENVAELDGPEKFTALSEAVGSLRGGGGGGAKFLPAEEQNLPGMKLPSVAKIQQDRVKARVNKAKDKFPEALPPRYEKDETGRFVMGEDGKPKPILEEYNFNDTPVAREAAKGLRGDEREDAAVSAIGEKLVKAAKTAQKNPDIAAGVTWYSTARTRLKKLLGDDTKFFAELLGATSARTPVETNFRFALDAYNQFKRGAYDKLLKKYREGKDRWESGETDGFPTRAAFLDAWVSEHDLIPMQSNGKKFAMNSQAVLKVLDGSWAEEVGGPKTPNFAGNLAGTTFEATIDVWASRLIHRLANEGNDKPWRILPENETGLSDADFALGQKIFRKAADKLGMKPDALQAILWFAEKHEWERRGWTRGAGALKSDFNSLLKETELTPSGVLKKKTPQLDLGLTENDITKKK